YRAWLLANGVRFVALSNARLDYSAGVEAYLVRRGVRGLRLAWRDADWRVYAVRGAHGILSGPGRLLSASGDDMALHANRAARFLLRVHYTPAWRVQRGAATISRSAAGWLTVTVRRPGSVALAISLPT
ncbi:MAG: hypothetical protein ABSE75_13720, partial [Acidimicrobiales bacterium]